MDNLITKIQKLLRLADSPNEHEAALAMAKAKAICVENEIDIASINLNQEKEEYINQTITLGGRNPVTANFASNICVNHFNVKVIYSGNRQFGKKVNFVGKKQDTEVASYVFEFVSAKFMDLWHIYQKNRRLAAKSRGSYLLGLFNGPGR